VFVDNQQIGTTPCSFDFTYYGTREIRLVKGGYETLTVNQPIPTPWYQIPPVDFVSDNLLPNEILDHRTVAFNLEPQIIVPTEQLIERGNQLRQETMAGVSAAPPGAIVVPGPGGPPGAVVPGAVVPGATVAPTLAPMDTFGPAPTLAPTPAPVLQPTPLPPVGGTPLIQQPFTQQPFAPPPSTSMPTTTMPTTTVPQTQPTYGQPLPPTSLPPTTLAPGTATPGATIPPTSTTPMPSPFGAPTLPSSPPAAGSPQGRPITSPALR
jgi:hypothetical protein